MVFPRFSRLSPQPVNQHFQRKPPPIFGGAKSTAKMHNLSNYGLLCYVNKNAYPHPFHTPPRLWKTPVDKSVENVEKH